MNAPSSPDEPLASWLAACQELMAAGGDPAHLGLPPEVPAELYPHVERLVGCLRLLNRPPTAGAAPTARAGGRPTAAAGPLLRLAGYEVLGVVGRGGMGVVYRARKTHGLGRLVALKTLPPGLAACPERLRRFRNEAEVAARLTDSRILPVLDLLETDAGPVLVMPYVEGGDLGRVIADRRAVREGAPPAGKHPWADLPDPEYLARVLDVLDEVLAAVTVIHHAGVLHRDIKPSNVLIDLKGSVWLTDFGLARLAHSPGLTTAGSPLGTPGFMSPEQWDGAEVDGRADVFGVAVTCHKALTLELPYGTGRLGPDCPAAPSLRLCQPLVPEAVDRVVLRALEPAREYRYQTADELRKDWQRARQGLLPAPGPRRGGGPPRARGASHKAAGLLVGTLLVGLLAVPAGPPGQQEGPAAPEVGFRDVRVTTEPPGARVVLVRVGEDGEPVPSRRVRPAGAGAGATTPLTLRRVPAGSYLLVAEVPGHGFHEVYRTVPGPEDVRGLYPPSNWISSSDGLVHLHVRILPEWQTRAGMAHLAGGRFSMGPDCAAAAGTASPAHTRAVAPFFLDRAEVTIGEYRRSGLAVPWELRQRYPDPYPVSCVTFHQALAFAERVGKRLPTEAEYEFAATDGGTRLYPWGDSPPPVTAWPFGPAGEPAFDRTRGDAPVSGLYSNVAEWTDSMLTPYDPRYHPSRFSYPRQWLTDYRHSRVVRGAPPSVLRGAAPDRAEEALGPRWLNPRWRQMRRCEDTSPFVGFRCARSHRPRFLDGAGPP